MKQASQKENKRFAKMTVVEEPPVPKHKWAVDDYAPTPTRLFLIPWPFLYVCKLAGVTPHSVLHRFMIDVSGDTIDRSINPAVREKAIAYFMERGYGQQFYKEEDMRQILAELDTLGGLWPQTNSDKLIDMHATWRTKYLKHWFKKWYNKVRRKDL
ncbi:hypothetical protein SAMN05421788_102152 [Filimonas lacunae]|uniref:Uncharacterized protein n=1 Tax=Filimonas lacunae TaxID=477680 RepID=A0A173MIC4_9BACT|nr:hypothetical protein [Filimonas lacunae]BAV07226.1 hypothetical protein FLA_3249 [Filimonas lacunae]SIS92954.1 hypothetical protein SAMN05421788_102152 [Filimonas lacunae]